MTPRRDPTINRHPTLPHTRGEGRVGVAAMLPPPLFLQAIAPRYLKSRMHIRGLIDGQHQIGQEGHAQDRAAH